ncbi:hypothetical protein SS1G_01837 [Sclerotinia sclerotiorum 1980 UF-70]|uniref:Isochorismatase-like domain-containing protein n=2 Tax=Sclerotinia sclerotiorum (strain ATCC 18683 / 1980 / Ss-1) TaxID=665079 RepID=A7E957_SCLS1|nr:hypothetical protein SS1G_01837 [Sclerotinia sclerotiorum 1980 UF-70]APA05794.1 hypothetical protein sscle_01g005640 [Sclerotinia sclerotiorum 1980 UF-70]EDN96909.1 hypothetical protein SS1G_01837 [Sclerotinia sclerotiorum 1980 UF-70]
MTFTPTKPPILLVVDLHQIEVDPPSSWGPRSTPHLTSNVSTLLSAFRKHSFPIIHIHHQSSDPKDELYPIEANASFIAPHACAAPLPNEPILIKNTGSAFASTKLKDTSNELDCRDRDMVVIGMEGAKCINSTVRDGSDLGLNMIVVVDACASFGIDYFKKEKVDAEEVHKVAMGILDGYARLVETDDLVEELRKWDGKNSLGS